MSEATFHPREITLPFGDGRYTFALPAVQIAMLQEARGWKVVWPDGAVGHKRKPFGLIWREVSSGEYDVQDLREIVRLGLIGGGKGVVGPRGSRETINVEAVIALELVEDYFDPMPTDEQWKLAYAVIGAVCVGFAPPAGDDEDKSGEDGDQGNAPGATAE